MSNVIQILEPILSTCHHQRPLALFIGAGVRDVVICSTVPLESCRTDRGGVPPALGTCMDYARLRPLGLGIQAIAISCAAMPCEDGELRLLP